LFLLKPFASLCIGQAELSDSFEDALPFC